MLHPECLEIDMFEKIKNKICLSRCLYAAFSISFIQTKQSETAVICIPVDLTDQITRSRSRSPRRSKHRSRSNSRHRRSRSRSSRRSRSKSASPSKRSNRNENGERDQRQEKK
ncbi:unnamed protein product [Rotaria socialis]